MLSVESSVIFFGGHCVVSVRTTPNDCVVSQNPPSITECVALDFHTEDGGFKPWMKHVLLGNKIPPLPTHFVLSEFVSCISLWFGIRIAPLRSLLVVPVSVGNRGSETFTCRTRLLNKRPTLPLHFCVFHTTVILIIYTFGGIFGDVLVCGETNQNKANNKARYRAPMLTWILNCMHEYVVIDEAD